MLVTDPVLCQQLLSMDLPKHEVYHAFNQVTSPGVRQWPRRRRRRQLRCSSHTVLVLSVEFVAASVAASVADGRTPNLLGHATNDGYWHLVGSLCPSPPLGAGAERCSTAAVLALLEECCGVLCDCERGAPPSPPHTHTHPITTHTHIA